MNFELKVTEIGDGANVILPKDLLAQLDVAIGQILSVTKTPLGIELRALPRTLPTQPISLPNFPDRLCPTYFDTRTTGKRF